jgi:DNA polymerase-3 subunit beta
MKFIINQKKLSDAVTLTSKAVSTRSTMPILEGLLIQTINQQLKLSASNQDISIVSYVEANVQEEGAIVVPSRIFSEIIKKLYNEDIVINVNEQHQITIQSRNSETVLQGFNADEYPSIENIDDEPEIIIEQSRLKNMIQRTIFSLAVEETRPILTGALFQIRNNEITTVCLDGYRLGLRKEEIDYQGQLIDVVIPGKTLQEISRILVDEDHLVKIAITQEKIMFDIGGTQIISKTLNGDFINHQQIIPNNYNTRIKIDVKSIYESVERAWLVAKEGNSKLVKFNIFDGKIIISSNSETGKFYEEIPVLFEGKELEIAFNSRYVMEALRVIEDTEAMIDFMTSVSPCVIKPLEGNHYIYLLLPVRIA